MGGGHGNQGSMWAGELRPCWGGLAVRFQKPLSPWKPPAVLDKLLTVHTTSLSARAGSRAFGRSVHIAMDTVTMRP